MIGFGAKGMSSKVGKRSDSCGLTKRQWRYLEERVKGNTKKLSALLAGYSESTAENAAQKIETPRLREMFARLITQVIPNEALVLRLAEGLDATRTIFATSEGAITDFLEVIDYSERRRYLELVAMMSRRYQKSQAVEPAGVTEIKVVSKVVSVLLGGGEEQ